MQDQSAGEDAVPAVAESISHGAVVEVKKVELRSRLTGLLRSDEATSATGVADEAVVSHHHVYKATVRPVVFSQLARDL